MSHLIEQHVSAAHASTRTDLTSGAQATALPYQPSCHQKTALRRNRIAVLGAASLGSLIITACASGGAAHGSGAGTQGASSPGVTSNSVTIGYIGDQTGVMSSASANSLAGFKARIDRQNADGGVDGRKIVIDAEDDGSSAQQRKQPRGTDQ